MHSFHFNYWPLKFCFQKCMSFLKMQISVQQFSFIKKALWISVSQKTSFERYWREEKAITGQNKESEKAGGCRGGRNCEENYLRTNMGIFHCLLTTAFDFSDLVLYGNNPNPKDSAVFLATGVSRPTGWHVSFVNPNPNPVGAPALNYCLASSDFSLIKKTEGFPGGAVVENLPANAGDTGSSPGLGRSHMPRSN